MAVRRRTSASWPACQKYSTKRLRRATPSPSLWQGVARKYDPLGMEKGDGKMIIGMREGAKRDGVRDQRIAKVVELAPPEKLLEELLLGKEQAKAVIKARQEVVDVLHGKDSRLLVVVGPCSVHDPKAALDYGRRLASLAKELSDRL